MTEITFSAMVEKLVNQVILEQTHGVPKHILTDRSSNFNSAFILKLYKFLNIAKNTTSAYYLQCDSYIK